MTDMPFVDSHAHIYTNDMPLSPSAWHRPKYEARLEDYIARLDEFGVARAVLAGASIFGDYNDYSLAAVEKYSRLKTTIVVNKNVTKSALLKMDRQGAIGVRLQLMHHDIPDLRDPDYRTLFRNLADMGWHVHVHDNAERLDQSLPALLETGLRIVVDHYGRPDKEQRLESSGFISMLRAIETGRVWVKMSSSFRLQDRDLAQEAAQCLIAQAGGERLLWGSDWPFSNFEESVTYADAIADFQSLIPTRELREKIGKTTPNALYFGD